MKRVWNKLSPYWKQWIILFMVSIEAALFYRFIMPTDIKVLYGKNMVHIVNLVIHWAIFVPIFNKILNIKGT